MAEKDLEATARAHGLDTYFATFPEEIARAVSAAETLTNELPDVDAMALEPAHTFSPDAYTPGRAPNATKGSDAS